jgi:hypothetical protein
MPMTNQESLEATIEVLKTSRAALSRKRQEVLASIRDSGSYERLEDLRSVTRSLARVSACLQRMESAQREGRNAGREGIGSWSLA